MLHHKLASFVVKHFFKEPSILANPKCAKGRNKLLLTFFNLMG